MPTYKALAEFEVDGGLTQVGSQVELSEEAAALLLEEGKIELVDGQNVEESNVDDADTPDVPTGEGGQNA